MAQPAPIKAYLHPAKAAAMFTAPHAETHSPPPCFETYLQNGLRQLITCAQSCMTSTLVISD